MLHSWSKNNVEMYQFWEKVKLKQKLEASLKKCFKTGLLEFLYRFWLLLVFYHRQLQLFSLFLIFIIHKIENVVLLP